MLFKITDKNKNLYHIIKNTKTITHELLWNWLSQKYDDIPKTITQVNNVNQLHVAYLRLVYEYINKELYKISELDYENVSNELIMQEIIKKIHEHFKYPSVISKWYTMLFIEMDLGCFLDLQNSEIKIKFDYNNYIDDKLTIDNFIVHILKWNINPIYFGHFIELVLSNSFIGLVEETKIKPTFDQLYYLNTLFSEITLKNRWYNEFYYSINCKSVYHYLAFLSLIKSVSLDKNRDDKPESNMNEKSELQMEKNIELFTKDYLKLIEKLESKFIQKEIENYLYNLYLDPKIIKHFNLSNRISYQKRVQSDLISGYIDFYSNDSIIDIKASSVNLQSINENNNNIITWYFQIYLYEQFLNENERKKYIVFNPISNILRVWNH